MYGNRSLVIWFAPKIGLDTEAEKNMQANFSVPNITCIWKVADFVFVPWFPVVWLVVKLDNIIHVSK